MIKYAIVPGFVCSKNDGDNHYINAARLMELYKVSPAECITIKEEEISILGRGLKILRPDYSGRYEIK